MSTSIITASYNNAITVSFTNDAWFNATEVAKQFSKESNNWLMQRDTAEYVATLGDMISESKTCFLQEFNKIIDLNGESAASRAKTLKLVKQTGLVKTKAGSPENGGGSWFHPKLAIAFARWLDVKFSIWCDMQIEQILHKRQPIQYGLKDPINEPEPLKIELSTVEQREPLRKAINYLIYCAKDNGRELSQERIYKTIQFRMGIDSVEELTVDRIQEARAIVGEIFQRVVIEGEYIAKGESEPQAKVEPEIPSEPFTNKEVQQYNRITSFIRNRFFHDGAWASAIGYRMRKATNNPSPNHFRIADKPIMAKEFEYLFAVTDRAKRMMSDFEKDIIRRLVRGEEDLETVFAEQDEKYKTLLNEIDQNVKLLLNTVDAHAVREFAA